MWKLVLVVLAVWVILQLIDNREFFDGASPTAPDGWNQIRGVGEASGILQNVGTVGGGAGTTNVDASPIGVGSGNREKYLEDMVKYLLIVVNMTNARQEKYKLENGYAQVFNSPRLDALEKQRQFFIEKVKKDPAELAFFRENLVVLI
jgi:L-aminopeptidase/D-esterase-like protein